MMLSLSLATTFSMNMQKTKIMKISSSSSKVKMQISSSSSSSMFGSVTMLGVSLQGAPRKATVSCSINNNTAFVNADSWDKLVLESDIPVLVAFGCNWCRLCDMRHSYTKLNWDGLVYKSNVFPSFYGRWCLHSRLVHRSLNELAEQYSGLVKCFVVDADKDPEIAKNYGINTLPAVAMVKSVRSLWELFQRKYTFMLLKPF